MENQRLDPIKKVTGGRMSRRAAVRGIAGAGAAATLMARFGGNLAVAQDTATPSASPIGGGDQVTLEWLGWSHFRLTSPGGKVILLNPWIEGNPDAVVGMADITRADLILAS